MSAGRAAPAGGGCIPCPPPGARPDAPDPSDELLAEQPFFKTPRKLVRQKWLGGLHSSYRWAA